MKLEQLERDDIQGLLVSGYVHLKWSGFILLRIVDPAAARAWIGRVAHRVTTARAKQQHDSLNVAFTYAGLAKLGLAAPVLAAFPLAFRDGMASDARRRILGDDGDDAPEHWAWGGPDHPVDVVLLTYAESEELLDRQLGKIRADVAGALAEVVALANSRAVNDSEHFGFADGIGQPAIRSTGTANEVPAGEFILGYANAYGKPAEGPRPFGTNGSYVVFRQLRQHVARFWQFLDAATRTRDGNGDPAARNRLAAKIVGRWPSGAPLVKTPLADDPALGRDNGFSYAELDPAGFACPLGSHIRRANPRDGFVGDTPKESSQRTGRHRLLRRGRSYGPRIADVLVDDGADRGLHFISLGADIGRGFELVQQTWLNNPSFAGLDGELDPLVGAQDAGGGTLTVQAAPVRTRVHGLPRFVTVAGGAYFFLPGMRALRSLGPA